MNIGYFILKKKAVVPQQQQQQQTVQSMGIKGLSALIADTCPEAIRQEELKNFFARKIAIDANMSMYQFLISIRGAYGGGTGSGTGGSGTGDLTNLSGEVTSHLQGLFHRTAKFMQLGIKPIYVFDGKPPEMKSNELKKRRERAMEAEEMFERAEEEGDEDRMLMMAKRTIRVTREQVEDGKKLLRLMGVPVVEAPSESEAQCAQMTKLGLVFGTATEDMDALTFGAPTLIRHLTFAESRKQPIQIFDLDTILKSWKITMDQFIDICILCGCDYCDSIRGIGPKKAHSMIKKYGNIESVVKSIRHKRQYVVPHGFLDNIVQVRELFKNPEVLPQRSSEQWAQQLKWDEPDEQGLIQFLVKEKSFDENRVKKVIAKLKASRGKAQQERLTSFFTVVKKGRGKIEPKKKDHKRNKRKVTDSGTTSTNSSSSNKSQKKKKKL
jgi:flap endonuclease-1